MSTSSDDKAAGLREAERERLFHLSDFPSERPHDETGVLLSNRIKHYCLKYKLIDPFSENLLRPAGYDLTVGRNYSILGERKALNDGMRLEIKPYQVAIIETYETIHLPRFLVGRWNIRVKRAYEGLLWVGGAQVDPGFRGNLCCPIYNLSTEAVSLAFRDTLAMIDFVTTTPFEEGACKEFPWRDRGMLIFSDYPLLRSGIEAQVDQFKQTIGEAKKETSSELSEFKKSTEASFRSVEMRIDSFVARIFTVVAVLFTALGITATKASDQLPFLSSPVWVAAVALWFALRANVDRSHKEPPKADRWSSWITPGVLAVAITAVIVAASMFLKAREGRVSPVEVQQVTEQASRTASAIEREKQERATAIQQLRQQSDAKIDSLQQQVNQLRQKQAGTR
jgi:deoxycytidine triphosphate deaminase